MKSRTAAIWIMLMMAGSVAAESTFQMPQRQPRQVQLFEGVSQVQRAGGQSFDDNWPWGGIEVSTWSGLYPVFFAASQTVDVGIPFTPWTSWVMRFEVTAGLLFTGVIFDWGVRAHFDFNDTFGVYAELMGRYGVGELTIVEIFEDAFEEVLDAGVDSVGGFGVSFAGGVEIGGGHIRFIAGVEYGALFIDTRAFAGDFRFDLPTITINYFGFQIGMRFYFG